MKYLLVFLLFTTNLFSEDAKVYASRVEGKTGNVLVLTSHGTCFAISNHGLVTAYHVLEGVDLIFIEVNNEWVPATVVAFDKEADLALIKVKSHNLTPVKLKEPEILVGYGSPEGKPIQEYKGTIEKVYVKTKITNGCSGGPIMDANGFLIGMITAKTSEGSQAVLISAEKVWDLVQKFLKEIK